MDPYEIARKLLGLALDLVTDLVGKEKASELLSQEAINRANIAADAIEEARGLK